GRVRQGLPPYPPLRRRRADRRSGVRQGRPPPLLGRDLAERHRAGPQALGGRPRGPPRRRARRRRRPPDPRGPRPRRPRPRHRLLRGGPGLYPPQRAGQRPPGTRDGPPGLARRSRLGRLRPRHRGRRHVRGAEHPLPGWAPAGVAENRGRGALRGPRPALRAALPRAHAGGRLRLRDRGDSRRGGRARTGRYGAGAPYPARV
ncbi:MAG: hypothetical protein AVDCRST_MAG12-1659, partial [uncultured Rubrobacteraceae bacterium]